MRSLPVLPEEAEAGDGRREDGGLVIDKGKDVDVFFFLVKLWEGVMLRCPFWEYIYNGFLDTSWNIGV